MKSETNNPSFAFWLVAILALIWFAMGCANFLYQLSPGSIESYGEAEQAMIRDRPGWATSGFALSVFGGLLGALLMLRRRQKCEPLFLASLAGTMIATSHGLFSGINPGPAIMAMTVALPIGIGIFFVWFSAQARRRDWLEPTNSP